MGRGFPYRGALAAAALLGTLALLAISIAEKPLPPAPAPTTQQAEPTGFRDLRFADATDGAVLVYDVSNSRTPIAVLDPGTNGFLRGTLRGLAHERLRDDAGGPSAPFRVAEWPGGRITLEDRATGRIVELNAFGHTNAEAFARFLTLPPAREGTP